MEIVLTYTALLVLIVSNPVSLIYLGLATAHQLAMHCYLKHPDARALAFCAGLSSILYVVLACLQGLAHL